MRLKFYYRTGVEGGDPLVAVASIPGNGNQGYPWPEGQIEFYDVDLEGLPGDYDWKVDDSFFRSTLRQNLKEYIVVRNRGALENPGRASRLRTFTALESLVTPGFTPGSSRMTERSLIRPTPFPCMNPTLGLCERTIGLLASPPNKSPLRRRDMLRSAKSSSNGSSRGKTRTRRNSPRSMRSFANAS